VLCCGLCAWGSWSFVFLCVIVLCSRGWMADRHSFVSILSSLPRFCLGGEKKGCLKEPVEGFTVELPNDSDLFRWTIWLEGPADTLYGGI
jgi:hypothetical protein